MDTELIKNLSIESLVLGFIVFLLVMFIKLPIKKISAKYQEPKRKAINIVIAFLPPILSAILVELFFGLIKSNWLNPDAIAMALSTWLVAASIYAIYSKISLIIKAAKSGEKINPELSSGVVKQLKSNIKTLAEKLKISEKHLSTLETAANSLIKTKDILESEQNLEKISQTNINIKNLELEKSALVTQIENIKNQIDSYKAELYVAKENKNEQI